MKKEKDFQKNKCKEINYSDIPKIQDFNPENWKPLRIRLKKNSRKKEVIFSSDENEE